MNKLKPAYYQNNGINLFDNFEIMFSDDEFRGFLKGNIFKYIIRYKLKNGIEDLNKAQTYLNRLIQLEENINEV